METKLDSNIFNGLINIAVAAIMRPIVVNEREVAVTLAFGFTTLLLTYPTRAPLAKASFGRRRGILLLLVYSFYLAAIIKLQPAGMPSATG